MTLAIHAALDRASNGELIRAAEQRGFDALVTADKNMKYQQNLMGRRIAIIVLPSGRWPQIEAELEEIVEAIDSARPGSYIEIASQTRIPPPEPPL